MNNLRNKVQLIGNLGMDPEVKELESGKTMAKFSIATRERYKDSKGNYQDDTQWHNVVAWGTLGKNMGSLLTKGKEVAIEGRLAHRHYDDKDGNRKYITEIVASEFVMLGKKGE